MGFFEETTCAIRKYANFKGILDASSSTVVKHSEANNRELG